MGITQIPTEGEDQTLDLPEQATGDRFNWPFTQVEQQTLRRWLGGEPVAAIGTVVFHGFVVNSTDEGTPFPTGWSVSNNSTGSCTLTHNLGTTDYTIVCTSEGTVSIMSPQTRGTDTITILSYSTAANLQNTDFFFMVVKT